jgi:hypothetical protein
MLGPTNRRRSGRLVATTLLAMLAQASLVMLSPLADVHYHEHGPLQIESLGEHHVSHSADQCPECLALQTLAVPGSPTYSLRSNWARDEAPTPTVGISHPVLRATSTFPRAPPSVLSTTL